MQGSVKDEYLTRLELDEKLGRVGQQNWRQTNTEANKVAGSVHKHPLMCALGNLHHQLLSGFIDPDTCSSELGGQGVFSDFNPTVG